MRFIGKKIEGERRVVGPITANPKYTERDIDLGTKEILLQNFFGYIVLRGKGS